MRKFRYLIMVTCFILTMPMWSGCSEEDVRIDVNVWPGEWVVYHDSVAVTDIIHGFVCDCMIDIPAEAKPTRFKA